MWRKWTVITLLEGLMLVFISGLTLTGYMVQDSCQPPPPPSITVQRPNGGEIWAIGLTQLIQWTSTNVSGDVMIELSRDGGTTWQTIIADTPNDGSEPWGVIGPESTQCRIRITSLADSTVTDTSDGVFTIGALQPFINLIAPNGGETWEINTVQTIVWSSASVSTVKIELSRDNGLTYQTLVASTPSLPGLFDWTVTGPTTAQARVRISGVENPSVSDTSLAAFTIQPSLKITNTSFSSPTATLGDTVVLTVTVSYGAGFPLGWPVTVQAVITKSDDRMILTLARDRETQMIQTTSAGTLLFSFPVTVGSDSYGGVITGTVAFLPLTAEVSAAATLGPCFSPECVADCRVLTAFITQFFFDPNTVGQGTGLPVNLHLVVRYWSITSGFFLLKVGKESLPLCANATPLNDQKTPPFSLTDPIIGATVEAVFGLTVTNNCGTQEALSWGGSIANVGLPFIPHDNDVTTQLTLLAPPLVTISIDPFVGVCKNGEFTAMIRAMGAGSATVNLTLQRTSGSMGEARFSANNMTTLNNVTISSAGTPVTIKGITESDLVDNMQLTATLTSTGQQATPERFSVVTLTRLDVHDAILRTTPRGNFYLATVSDNVVAIEAKLNPDLPGLTDTGIISWTGGDPSPDAPLRRIVSTTTPNTVTTVTARCGSQSMSVVIVVARGCGTGVQDDRTQMQGEYLYYSAFAGLGILDPLCSEFTQSASSQYFTFSELNSGDYSWALIREPLVISQTSGYGLDRWRVEYGGPRTINSGYRNPVHNDSIGGATNSRHMFGDAVDLRNESRTEDEWNQMEQAARRANPDFVEPRNGPCGIGCVHADWRDHPGGYVP